MTTEDGLFIHDTSAQTVGGEIKIALLSDFEHKDVFDYAVSEYNREQASITSSNYHIVSKTVDVPAGNPAIIDDIKRLEEEGFKYFIGPLASSSAAAAKVYTDNTTDIVLLSPSSTAVSLGIPGDSLFRLVLDDEVHPSIIMNRIQSDGREHVVLIYRDDTWGVGLHDTITRDYVDVVAHTIQLHSPNGSNADKVAMEAAARVGALISSHGADNVGVLLLAFDHDTVALVRHIASDAALASTLGDVRWYGGDGTAGQSELVDNLDVAAFLSSVRFDSSKFEVAPNSVNLRIDAQEFVDDATYGDNLYDAVFLLADTVIINDEELATNPASTVRSLIIDVANGLRDHDHRHSLRTVGDGALGAYELDPRSSDMEVPPRPPFEVYEIFEKPDGSFDWRIIRANVCR
ncbi:MAG: hypothetical protein J4F28_08200 [Nitrosopumilaceae archaeon]|nr:hypothetical protein [Nitrosopumilaceae archaeon]